MQTILEVKQMNTTLSGLKVIELSTFIAVPACARFFADNGADVIKVEAKGGDAVRWNGTSEGRSDSPYENTTFDLENANKKGIVLISFFIKTKICVTKSFMTMQGSV